MDRVRNEEMHRGCGSKISIDKRMDKNVFRLYCHVERMREDRVVKSAYVEGGG
jgi:hypothetical protein